MQEANVFAIKRFAVHDGPGIRTTIFLKGCPLKCLWCHNPEGISPKTEIALYAHKCTSCRACASVCKSNAHIFDNGHIIDREKCVRCGACGSACPNEAITVYGETMTVDKAFDLLMEDKDFYDCSSGGVTVSGGECLLQPDFVCALLKRLKDAGVHTAVDTCGCVKAEIFDRVMPYTDVFLYDIKAFSEETHIKCTGVSNKLIWANLEHITKNGAKCIIRYPYVPTYNSDDAPLIAKRLSTLKNITAVDILAYHNFSGSKYDALSLKNTMPDLPSPTNEEINRIRVLFSSFGLNVNDLEN